MKRLVILTTILSVCLASAQFARGEDEPNKKKKKQAQTTATATPAPKTRGTQTSSQRAVKSNVKSVHTNTGTVTSANQQNVQRTKKSKQTNVVTTNNTNQQNIQSVRTNKSKKQTNIVTNNNTNQQNVQVTKKSKQTNVVTNRNVQVNKKAFRHFKRTGNEFSFTVARSRIVRERHDRIWWRQHFTRIVFYGGGYWYWNGGWWYPAWGYDPYYSSYVYDGPIFGYGYAAPGDVTAEVQRALAYQGYYYGPIDGILGPGTRGAIQRYQIDHGLAVTAAIDEPTLATLGLT